MGCVLVARKKSAGMERKHLGRYLSSMPTTISYHIQVPEPLDMSDKSWVSMYGVICFKNAYVELKVEYETSELPSWKTKDLLT